jgi:DNA-binding NarL/FixJ family response regulator
MPSAPPPPAPPLPGPTIRIVLVEDHDMVAEAIRMALDRTADLEVVGRSASMEAALADTTRLHPDVVLLDRRLPDGDGIDGIAGLKAAAPGCRVLVLAGEATASAATRVAEEGGAGLILKADNLGELQDAVRRVAAGEVAFSKGLLGAVLDRLTGRTPDRAATLTRRERETLDLLGEGLGSVEISRRLGVALNTARNHIQRVLEKLDARSQLEAVTTARREGLLR